MSEYEKGFIRTDRGLFIDKGNQVFDVTHPDFGRQGAKGDGVSNDTAAIQDALNMISSNGGGTLYFPDGTYLLNSYNRGQYVNVPSNTRITGGKNAILKRRAEDSSSFFFRLAGVSNVTIEGLTFDYNGADEFFGAVYFRGAANTDIRVVGNKVYDSDTPGSVGDRWFVVLANETADAETERVWITDNHVEDKIQLTASIGRCGLHGAWISRNTIVDGQSNAISLLMTNSNQAAVVEDVFITDNVVIAPAGIGIAVGPDNTDHTNNTWKNIHITGNTVTEVPNGASNYGIFARMGDGDNTGLNISGNTVSGLAAAGNTHGIYITDDHDSGARRWSNVTIANNRVSDCGWGIRVRDTTGLTISDNTLSGCNIHLLRAVKAVTLNGNVVSGGSYNYDLDAGTTDIGPIYMVGNIGKNGTAGGMRVNTAGGTTASVFTMANRFYDDQTPKIQPYGIVYSGVGTFDCRHVFDDYSGNLTSGASNTNTTVLFWCKGTASNHYYPTKNIKSAQSHNWADLASGAVQSQAFTVSGAALGDLVDVSMSIALSGTRVWGEVTATDTVTVYHWNPTGGAVNLGAGNVNMVLRNAT